MSYLSIKKVKRERRRGNQFLDRIDPSRSFMLAPNLISRPRLRRDVAKRMEAVEIKEGEDPNVAIDQVTKYTIDEIAKDFYQCKFPVKLSVTELEELPKEKSSGNVA